MITSYEAIYLMITFGIFLVGLISLLVKLIALIKTGKK